MVGFIGDKIVVKPFFTALGIILIQKVEVKIAESIARIVEKFIENITNAVGFWLDIQLENFKNTANEAVQNTPMHGDQINDL